MDENFVPCVFGKTISEKKKFHLIKFPHVNMNFIYLFDNSKHCTSCVTHKGEVS